MVSTFKEYNFYKWLIILPGKNPGTSTNVTRGMLKASQNLTNLAPFTDELISKHPTQQIHLYMTSFEGEIFVVFMATAKVVPQSFS